MRLVTEIEDHPFKDVLAFDQLKGPVEKVRPFFSAWLENLNGISDVDDLTDEWCSHLDKLAAAHPDAFDFLPNWTSRFVTDYQNRLSPTALQSCWESLNTAVRYVDRCVQLNIISRQAESISKETVEGFEEVHPLLGGDDDFSEFNTLRVRLSKSLQKWSEEARGAPPVVQDIIFIRHFLATVAPLHQGGEVFWHSFLSVHLEGILQRQLANFPRVLLADPISCLVAASSRFDCIQDLRTEGPALIGSWDSEKAEFFDIILASMVLRSLPGSGLRNRFFQSVSGENLTGELADVLHSFQAARPKVCEWLRSRYERSRVDWFEDTLELFSRLARISDETDRAIETWHSDLLKTGEDLAVGVKGQNLAKRGAYLLQETLRRAVWGTAAEADARYSATRFRRSLILDLGVDYSEEVWRKHSRIQAKLASLANDAAGRSLVTPALPLIRLIDQVVPTTRPATRDFDLASGQDADGGLLTHEDLLLIARRVVLEVKLSPERNLAENIDAWFFEFVLCRLGPGHSQQISASLRALGPRLYSARDGLEVPSGLLASLDLLAEHLSDLDASLVLSGNADTLIQLTPREMQRDNVKTLVRLAAMFNPVADFSSENFSQWWSRSIADIHFARGGEDLFKRNLEGLYQGLSGGFTQSQAARVFSILHEVCKEVTGVSVTIAALCFRSYQHEGHLWRRLLVPAAPQLPSGVFAGEEILTRIPQASVAAHAGLVSVWKSVASSFRYHGDAELAWWSARSQLEQLLGQSSTGNLISALSEIGFACAEMAEGDKSGPWLLLLEAGLEQTQQLCLGRKLSGVDHVLVETISKFVYLSHPDEFGEGAARLQATVSQWSGLLARAVDGMKHLPPSLARLNAGRHFVELVLAHSRFEVGVWRSLCNALAVSAAPVLDNADRSLWMRWLGLLETLANAAPALSPVAVEVFRSDDYVFSPKAQEEEEIRAIVSSVLVLGIWKPILEPTAYSTLVARLALATEITALKGGDDLARLLRRLPDLLSSSLPQPAVSALEHLTLALERAIRLADLMPGWPAAMAVPCVAGEPDVFWRRFRLPSLGEPLTESMLATADTPLQVVCGKGVPLADLNRRRDFIRSVWRFDSTLRPIARRIVQAAVLAAATSDSEKAISAAALRLVRTFGHGSELLLPDSFFDAVSLSRLASSAPDECSWPEIIADIPIIMGRLRSGLTLQIKASDLADAVGAGLTQQTGLARLTKALAAPRLHLFFQRLGACLLEDSQPSPVLLDREFSAACRAQGFGPVLALYAQIELQLVEHLSPEVQRNAAEILWKSQIVPTHLGTADWAVLFASRRGETPDFLIQAPALVPELAKRASEIVAPLHNGVGQLELASALEETLLAFLRPLARGGDLEEGWSRVLRSLDFRLDGISALAVEAGLLALRPILAEKVAAPALPFWHLLVGHAVEAVQQAAAGRRLASLLAAASSGIVQQWSPSEGSSPEQAEHDTHLLLVLFAHLSVLLRTQPPTVLWLNFGRWWVENLLPFDESGKDGWQPRLRLLEDIVLPESNPTEAAGLVEVVGGLIQLGGAASSVRPLALALVGAKTSLVAAEEELPPQFVSGLLASALLPDATSVPGRALLQRLFLSHSSLADRGESGWRATSSNLLSTFNKLAANQLPASVTKRLADLPRLAALVQSAIGQPGHGLPYFAALLSGWPATKPLWISSLLARTNPASGLGSQGPGDLVITQQVGWELPGDADLQGRLRLCSGVWALGDRFPVRAPEPAAPVAAPVAASEPAKRGFFGFGRAAASAPAPVPAGPVRPSLVFSPEWHPSAATLLRSLTLRQVVSPETPLESWVSQDRSHFPFIPDDSTSRIAFLQAVLRHLHAQFGDRQPVSQAFAEYVRLWAGFALAQRLIRPDRSVISATASPLGLSATAASAALRYCGLLALGLRSADDVAAYAKTSPGPSAVNGLQKILSSPEGLQASLAKAAPTVEMEAFSTLLPHFKSTLLA